MIYITYAHFKGDLVIRSLYTSLKNHEVPRILWPQRPSIRVIARDVENMLNKDSPTPTKIKVDSASRGIYRLTVTRKDESNLKYVAYGESPYDRWEFQDSEGKLLNHDYLGQVTGFKDLVERSLYGLGGLFNGPRDLSPWFSQELLQSPLVPSVARPGGGGGAYLTVDTEILSRIKDAFDRLSERSGASLLTGGHITILPLDTKQCDVLDLLEPLHCDIQRGMDAITQRLNDNAEGIKKIQSRGYAKMLRDINDMEHKVALFGAAMENLADTDQLQVLRTRLEYLARAVHSAEMGASLN